MFCRSAQGCGGPVSCNRLVHVDRVEVFGTLAGQEAGTGILNQVTSGPAGEQCDLVRWQHCLERGEILRGEGGTAS